MAMTPRVRSAAASEASFTSAPRSLNELVTWRFSYLTKTSAPVSAESFGAGSMGVRSSWPKMVRCAPKISAMVTTGPIAPLWDRSRPVILVSSRRGETRAPPPRPTCAASSLPSFSPHSRTHHGRERTTPDRVHHRGETPCLRSGCQSRIVPGGACAARDRLFHRFLDHHGSDRAHRPVHSAVRRVYLRHRVAPVLVVVTGGGDLGHRLLWTDVRQRSLRHHRHADDGP